VDGADPAGRRCVAGRHPAAALADAAAQAVGGRVRAAATAGATGLAPASDAEHTEVFVLNCPPYAAVYLGPDGALGGEGADRVAGFWRALDLTPPAEPDHLAALLALYASLGEAAGQAAGQAATGLDQAAAALFAEHIWPWLPGYLDAVTDVAGPALTGWAQLMRRALAAERRVRQTPARMPLALREAPAGTSSPVRPGDLTDALTIPVRSGIVLTRARLARGAAEARVGHRIGERRFTLRAMLEQDPVSTLGWLGSEARRWEARHRGRATGDPVCQWWAARAAATAVALTEAGTGISPAGALTIQR
jgi:TorA maturation chaperone TorD